MKEHKDKDSLIAKLGELSIKNFRATFLILFAVLLGGYLTYVNFLPRKGFPELTFPTALIQVPYAVDDINTVNKEITMPIEDNLSQIEEIESFNTVTTPTISFITVSFKSDVEVLDGVAKLNNQFEKNLKLPSGVEPSITAIKPNSIDGENDILIGISSHDKSDMEVQQKAQSLASELKALDEVKATNVKNTYEYVYNPKTNKESLEQVTFNRVATKNNGNLEFEDNIVVGLVKEDNFNITDVSKAIHDKLESLENSEDFENYQFTTIYDEAIDLNTQIHSLETNALAALISVAFVLFFFVSYRASLIGMIFIPSVLAITFILMLLFGISLNIISLFALVLVLGLLVDDAIVVIENIDYNKRKGMKGIEAIKYSLKTVGKADILGTSTTILVFFPMLAITGFLGDIIKDVPLTIITTLTVSLVLALTLIPVLCQILIPDVGNKKSKFDVINLITDGFGKLVIKAGTIVSKFINFYLSKTYLTVMMIVLSIVIILSGFIIGSQLKNVNFPEQKDSDGVNILIVYPEELDIAERLSIAKDIEELIVKNHEDEVQRIIYPDVGRDFTGRQFASIFVELISMRDRKIKSPEIAEKLTEEIEKLNLDASITATEQQVGGPGTEEYPSRVQIFSENVGTLETAGLAIAEYIKDLDLRGGVEVLDTKVDNLDTLTKLNGRRYAEVASKLSDGFDDQTISEIESKVKDEFTENKLKELKLSKDALETDRGFATEITKSVISAGVALLASIVFLYFFLVIQYNSFGKAVLIMLGIPFSLFGLFGGLYITNNSISFFTIIGMIALVGIVLNNGIMLLDFASHERMEGKDIKTSIVDAVRIRFRPLLTTTATTVVGLIPLALTEPFWEALAFTIVFGLLSSTTMLILIFPAYYSAVENLRERKLLKSIVGAILICLALTGFGTLVLHNQTSNELVSLGIILPIMTVITLIGWFNYKSHHKLGK